MRFFALPALFLSVAAAMPALAAPHQFTNRGETYSYTVERDGKAGYRLVGEVVNTGEPIDLSVHGRDVSGKLGDDTVNFRLPLATTTRLALEANGGEIASAN